MPRLIDADKVAEAIAWLDEYDFVIWHDVQECIDKVPTVDAEPVIRCKDCRFYNTHDHRCVRMNHGFKDDFFCSWGERKDE